jgi:hypothetical protein
VPDQIPAAFISYSREDSEFALRLAKSLKEAGANVWLDQLELVPGYSWDSAIETALKSATKLLLILSPSSARSDNVRDELFFALERGKIVIPILFKDCDVPLRLQRTQRIDFRTNYSHGLLALLGHLGVANPNQGVPHKVADSDANRLRENAERPHSEDPVVVAHAPQTTPAWAHVPVASAHPTLISAPPTHNPPSTPTKSTNSMMILGIGAAVVGAMLFLILFFSLRQTPPTAPAETGNSSQPSTSSPPADVANGVSTPPPTNTDTSQTVEQPRSSSSDTSSEIQAAVETWRQAMLSNDADRLATCYASEVSRFFLVSNVSHDWIRDYLEKTRGDGYAIQSLDINNLTQTRNADGSVEVDFQQVFSNTSKGVLKQHDVHTTQIYVLEDGSWKIEYERQAN